MDKFDGCWAIVLSGDMQYIGRIVPAKREGGITRKIEALDELFTNNSWVALKPAFEFMTPLGQNSQGQISRQSIVTPFGFTLDEELPHYMAVTRITFFEDMKDDDRAVHQNFIKSAREAMTNARAGRAGILLESGNARR